MKFNVRRIEKERMAKKLSIREMALKIGVSHQKYYDFLKEYGTPNLGTINRIAGNLGIHPIELIEFE